MQKSTIRVFDLWTSMGTAERMSVLEVAEVLDVGLGLEAVLSMGSTVLLGQAPLDGETHSTIIRSNIRISTETAKLTSVEGQTAILVVISVREQALSRHFQVPHSPVLRAGLIRPIMKRSKLLILMAMVRQTYAHVPVVACFAIGEGQETGWKMCGQ